MRRAWDWEAWPKEEHRAAGQPKEYCQKLQDMLTGTPQRWRRRERWRVAIKKGRRQYKQLKLGALGGELAIETVCKPIEEVGGMTEEELKRWKHRKTSKKPVKGRGGKMKGETTAAKPVDTATAGFGGLPA